tara:strand:- start:115 stop:801 length:687 start_codon:yes stop_codon:yes gene_type:complete
MEFKHEEVDLGYKELDTITMDDGTRQYLTLDGNSYPSVTTVLSILNEEKIRKWKEKVGKEKAEQIGKVARDRGTSVHEIIEKFLNNESTDGYLPHITQSLNNLKPLLEKRLTKVYAQEVALYSDHLELAGRCDCVAEFDGELTIIDFKTSRFPKKKQHISNYFIQGSAYAIMWEERTGMPVSSVSIVMDVDNFHPCVYKEKRDSWTEILKETIQKYKERRELDICSSM